MVIAHRGVSSRALENSLAALELALVERCDGIELDVHLTADGELVVHHDPLLGDGRAIATLASADLLLHRLSDGSAIPTLAEVLGTTGTLDLFIEAKSLPPEGDDRLATLIRSDPHPDRLHIHAFDHRIIARLAARADGLSLGVLSASYPVDPVRQVLEAGAVALWQEWPMIDAELVGKCAAAGVAVIAWTVNSAEAAENLTRIGVAGLCGNWPERIRRGVQNVRGAP